MSAEADHPRLIWDELTGVAVKLVGMLGAVMSEPVVTLNVADTPPTVSVVTETVLGVGGVVSNNATVCPLDTVPVAEVQAPPFIEYCPPTTDTFVGAVVPVMVTAFDVYTVFNAAPVCDVKENGSG